MTPESRLDEYQAEAERLLSETVALIPADLDPQSGFSESEPRYAPTEGAASASDAAWWQARENLNLAAETDASADAAAAIAAGLTADGWRESTVRETEGGARITDGFRKDLDTDILGKHVLIVEDIIDSGLTLSWLLENFAARGAASVEVFALLRKPEAAKVEVRCKYVGFDIPTEFVVGYGLDYAEKYRNLRDVAVLAPHVYS